MANMLETPVSSCGACPLGSSGSCQFVPRSVESGTRLGMQGEVPREVVFVKEGVLALSATDAAGHELMAGVRGPRGMIGLEALKGHPSRASVVALTDAVVCSVDAGHLRATAGLDSARPATSPQVAVTASALLQVTLDELDATQRDADLRSGPALTRVARFILAYSRVMRPNSKVAFSKRHVAALLDVRPETMSRCLKKLVDDGLIVSEPRVEVRDEARLAEVARGGTH
jgi:CRP-like cAMP-binding protein